MSKSWVRTHKLGYVLITSPIIGFVVYLEIGQPFSVLLAIILAGFIAYKYALPLADKLLDKLENIFGRGSKD